MTGEYVPGGGPFSQLALPAERLPAELLPVEGVEEIMNIPKQLFPASNSTMGQERIANRSFLSRLYLKPS